MWWKRAPKEYLEFNLIIREKETREWFGRKRKLRKTKKEKVCLFFFYFDIIFSFSFHFVQCQISQLGASLQAIILLLEKKFNRITFISFMALIITLWIMAPPLHSLISSLHHLLLRRKETFLELLVIYIHTQNLLIMNCSNFFSFFLCFFLVGFLITCFSQLTDQFSEYKPPRFRKFLTFHVYACCIYIFSRSKQKGKLHFCIYMLILAQQWSFYEEDFLSCLEHYFFFLLGRTVLEPNLGMKMVNYWSFFFLLKLLNKGLQLLVWYHNHCFGFALTIFLFPLFSF